MLPSPRAILLTAVIAALGLAVIFLLFAYQRGAQRLRFNRGQIATGTTPLLTATATDAIYLNPELGLILRYPSTWAAEAGGITTSKLPTRFRGADGFFELAITGEPGTALSLIVNEVAYGEEKPYGDNPRISAVTIGGQDGRLIAATDPQITDAAILVPFPQPVKLNGQTAAFLVLHADRSHLETLAARLRFVRNQSGDITGLPNILVYQPRSNEVVSETMTVNGVARVFENTFSLRLVDPYTNKIFLEQTVMAAAPDVGSYGVFAIELNLPRFGNSRGLTLELFQASPRAGTPQDVVMIPLRLVQN